MKGFYVRDQLDIISPYFDKFYEVLPLLFKTMPHKSFN